MIVSKKLEWLKPYIDIALPLISPDIIITRITAWDYKKSRGVGCHAAVIRDREGAPFRIYMHTHFKECNKFIPYSKIDLLTFLAHEIAHTEHWNHTPEHKTLEVKILKKFISKLKKDGYISEEKEMRKKPV